MAHCIQATLKRIRLIHRDAIHHARCSCVKTLDIRHFQIENKRGIKVCHFFAVWIRVTGNTMKKLKNESALFKEAFLAGVKYAEGRGVVEFEAGDSASEKLLYIYRLMVHDKVLTPLPEDQVAEKSLRHKLTMWYSKQLPKDHPLLK
jgi:hypothetical protein